MKVRLLILAATFCLGSASEALGAINDWTAIGPSGGYISKIVFNRSTPSTVYAIAAGGFYRSQDGGVSWKLINSNFFNMPEDLAIDPSDATRLYVVAPNYPSLYVSTDGGSSLTAVTTLPTAYRRCRELQRGRCECRAQHRHGNAAQISARGGIDTRQRERHGRNLLELGGPLYLHGWRSRGLKIGDGHDRRHGGRRRNSSVHRDREHHSQ